MKFLSQIYQYINILSLDVVAGAVISAIFFSRLLAVHPPASVFFCLGLIVWIIYTIDHLRDAKSIASSASTDRHRFHQLHFKVIAYVLAAAIALTLVAIFFLPTAIIQAGLILGSVVSLYLLFQRYLKFMKEFFVACLYTAGIVLPSLAFGANLLPEHHLIIAKFVITALMNLLLFSLFDLEVDRDQQQHSFVTWFGAGPTRYAIILLGMVNILMGLSLWSFDVWVARIFITMNAMLIAVLLFQKKLVQDNYYRIVGDAVFLIPGFYLL